MMSAPDGDPSPRRRGRRLRRLLWWGLGVAVVGRIALWLFLPDVLSWAASRRGMDLAIGDLDLSLSTGRVAARQVSLAPLPSPQGEVVEPWLDVDFLTLDVDVSALVGGTLRVQRVEVDGARVLVERDEQGVWNWSRLQTGASPEPPREPASEPEPESPSPGPWPEVIALRLQHVDIRIRDPIAQPPIDRALHLTAAASDVGVPGREARFEVFAGMEGVLDALHVTGGMSVAEHASGALELDVRGLRPMELSSYLEPVGVIPIARDVAASISVAVSGDRVEERLAPVRLVVSDSWIHADSVEQLHVGELVVEAGRVDVASARDVDVSVNGLRVAATRTAAGVRVGGFELVGRDPDAPQEDSPDDEPSFRMAIRAVRADDAHVDFDDVSTDPPTRLAVAVASAVAGPFDVGGGETAPLSVAASLSAPGVAESIVLDVTHGAQETSQSWVVDLDADGVTLDAVRPYLRAASIEPTLTRGELRVDGSVTITDEAPTRTRIDVELQDLRVADQGRVLCSGIGSMRGFVSDRAEDRVTLGDVALDGVRFDLVRRSDGALEWPGFLVVSTGAADATPSGTSDTEDDPEGDAGLFAIPSLRVSGETLRFVDHTVEPPLRLVVEEVSGTVEDLVTGGRRAERRTDPTTIRLELRAPDVCERLVVSASAIVQPTLDVDGEASLQVSGLTDDVIGRYLREIGIEPTIDRDELSLEARGSARRDGETLRLDASASASYRHSGEAAVEVRELAVRGALLGRGTVTVDEITVSGAAASLRRDAEGAMVVGGLAFPAAAGEDGVAGSEREVEPTPEEPARWALGRVTGDLAVRWRDDAIDPPVDTTVTVGLDARDLVIDGDAIRAAARVDGAATGIVERFALDASLTRQAKNLSFRAGLEVDGARPASIDGYLPGTGVSLTDGRLRSTLTADVKEHPAGGHAVTFALRDVSLADARRPTPWLSLESFAIDAARVDPDAATFEVSSVTSRGLRVAAVRDAGGLDLLGLRFADAPTPPDEPAVQPETPTDEARIATVAPALPSIRVGAVDIGVDAFSFEDHGLGGQGTSGGRLRITTPSPQVVLGPDPEELDALALTIEASAPPLLERAIVEVEVAPFAPDPRVEIDLRATGLRGPEIARAMPSLAGEVDLTGLPDATLTASLELDVHPRDPRRSPLRLDPTKPFSAELMVTDVALRPTPSAQPIAGFDMLSVSATRVDPQRGEVVLRSVELNHPFGDLVLEQHATRFAGVAIRLDETPGLAVPDAPSVAEPAEPPPGELRVDTLVISDVELGLVDRRVEPAVRLPIVDLDLEARQLSSRMTTEPRPFRFRVNATGGDIELTKRSAASNLLIDAAAGATQIVGQAIGRKKERALESRPAFESLDVAGRLALHPKLDGYIKGGVRGVELSNLAGLAADSGFTLRDGLVDNRLDLRFDAGSTTIRNDSTVAYLSMTEPAGGPISRTLKLTSPLPVVLAVLRDQSGDIRLPVRLTLREGGVSRTALTGAITKALSSLITDAIASSPFRVAGTVTDLAALIPTPMSEAPVGEDVEVVFTPASTRMLSEDMAALREVAVDLAEDSRLLLEVRHELGQAGVARVAELANPPRERTLELAQSLRQRKSALIEEQRGLIAAAHADQRAGLKARAARTIEEVRRLDQRLESVEAALDQTLALLQPGAERRRDQRTRAACLDVARRRLSAVSAVLADVLDEQALERVRFRPPRYQVDPEREHGRVVLTVRRSAR